MDICYDILKGNKTKTLFFLNAHCFNIAQTNKEYYQALQKTDLLLNDGVGLKIASRFSEISFQDNLNGTDLIPKIIGICRQQRKKVFLLGAKPGVAEKAVENLKKRYEGITITGYYSGFFTNKTEKDIIKSINETETDLLILGLGVPKQELWSIHNKNQLHNVKLIIAGGAIIDFISGEITRAPMWMRRFGLEWFYRLTLEPGRMWRRYIIGNFIFFYHVIRLRYFTKN